MVVSSLQFEGDVLDFNQMLIENPIAIFAVRISGQSMTGVGIFPGNIAIVDRSKTPVNGSIILAIVDGEFTIKRHSNRDGRVTLCAENPAYPDIEINDGMDFEIWGCVRHTIRNLIDAPDAGRKRTRTHSSHA